MNLLEAFDVARTEPLVVPTDVVDGARARSGTRARRRRGVAGVVAVVVLAGAGSVVALDRPTRPAVVVPAVGLSTSVIGTVTRTDSRQPTSLQLDGDAVAWADAPADNVSEIVLGNLRTGASEIVVTTVPGERVSDPVLTGSWIAWIDGSLTGNQDDYRVNARKIAGGPVVQVAAGTATSFNPTLTGLGGQLAWNDSADVGDTIEVADLDAGTTQTLVVPGARFTGTGRAGGLAFVDDHTLAFTGGGTAAVVDVRTRSVESLTSGNEVGPRDLGPSSLSSVAVGAGQLVATYNYSGPVLAVCCPLYYWLSADVVPIDGSAAPRQLATGLGFDPVVGKGYAAWGTATGFLVHDLATGDEQALPIETTGDISQDFSRPLVADGAHLAYASLQPVYQFQPNAFSGTTFTVTVVAVKA